MQKNDDSYRTNFELSLKVAEYDHVLVFMPFIREFQRYILNAKTRLHADNDDGRVYYVAFSRAMKKLYINIPTHTDQLLQKLGSFNLKHEIVS